MLTPWFRTSSLPKFEKINTYCLRCLVFRIFLLWHPELRHCNLLALAWWSPFSSPFGTDTACFRSPACTNGSLPLLTSEICLLWPSQWCCNFHMDAVWSRHSVYVDISTLHTYAPVPDYSSPTSGRLHPAFTVTTNQLWLGKTGELLCYLVSCNYTFSNWSWSPALGKEYTFQVCPS